MRPTLTASLAALAASLALTALPLTAAAQGAAKEAAPLPGVLTQPAPNQAAKVNGKVIPKSRVDLIVKQQGARGGDPEQLRKAVIERLVNFELVVQEAEKKGLTRNADVQTQIELQRQQIILNVFMDDWFKTRPIKEELLRAEYNKIRSQRGGREYKARHILVEKEAEAKAILEKLEKGEKFEDLARASLDPGSKDKGGELDWALPGTFVKPFADALAKLEKGKTTEAPVQSQFGFHVIRVDDVRTAPFPTFEQARPQILNFLQEQEVQKVFAELRAKAKIE